MALLNRYWFIALLPGAMVFASVNDPIRFEWMSGYRNDTLHWHLIDVGALAYTERARDLQFWENSLALHAIYRDIAFFARGSVGAFGSGPMKQRFSDLSYTSDSPTFHWNTAAFNADGWGYFGYGVNLTEDRTYQVIFIPMIGYGVDYERLDRDGSHDVEGAANPPAASYSMTSILPGNERLCWFGPLFGGVVVIQPLQDIRFETGYAYHRLHLRFDTKRLVQVSLSEPGAISESFDKIKVKDGANLSHSGWARIDYQAHCWRIGLEAQIQYFASRILNASIKDEESGERSSQKFKARWTAVSGLFSLSRTF